MENKKERAKERQKFNDTVRELVLKLQDKDPRYKKFILVQQQEKEGKRKKMEEEKALKRAEERERLHVYREERAAQYAKEEDEAIARGDFEEVIIDEFLCEICNKKFKKEGQLDNHLKSKKHKEAEAKFKATLALDPETEELLLKQEEERLQKIQDEKDKIEEERKNAILDEINQKKKPKKKGKKEESDSSDNDVNVKIHKFAEEKAEQREE